RGYTIQDLCGVEDQTGPDKYVTSIMTWLKSVDSEDPLVLRWSAISGSSPMWTEGLLAGKYLRGALHPVLAKQVYECSSEELMNRADNALIDRVHDTGWLVQSQHEKILTFWVANKELKLRAYQELVTTVEHRVKELEEEAKKSRADLESLKNQHKKLG
ncbi:hypothetical protein B296_00010412, partial [Ensete ventricosum]